MTTPTLHLSSQGKEIIEFYLKELEDEGVGHVPRWTASSRPQAASRPTSLSISPPALPPPTVLPSVSVSQPSDSKDAASQDGKQDGAAAAAATAVADSLTEILAATPEGQ